MKPDSDSSKELERKSSGNMAEVLRSSRAQHVFSLQISILLTLFEFNKAGWSYWLHIQGILGLGGLQVPFMWADNKYQATH